MAFKFITLNIEKDRHLHIVLPFLMKEKPDVLCLQEVFEEDFEKLKEVTGLNGVFDPVMKGDTEIYAVDKTIIQGNVILTRFPNYGFKSHTYFGDKNVPVFTTIEDIPRKILFTTIDVDGKKFNIGTTHFTWTPKGTVTKQQLKDQEELMKTVKKFDDFILCGDFNAPRGKKTFQNFEKHFKDNVPIDINTTLDLKLHKRAPLYYVVDTIFSTKGYTVSDVRVVDGLSDHMAIIGIVE